MKNAALVLSSLVNAGICFFSFWFGVFATSPDMQDATMRIGFYVVNSIAVAALMAVFLPWIFAYRGRTRWALAAALLPAVMTLVVAVLFLTLDSWLRRTF